MSKVAIIMGSQSDLETVQAGIDVLKEFKVNFEVKILSAHRTPRELAAYVAGAQKQGVKVFIAAAGGSRPCRRYRQPYDPAGDRYSHRNKIVAGNGFVVVDGANARRDPRCLHGDRQRGRQERRFVRRCDVGGV